MGGMVQAGREAMLNVMSSLNDTRKAQLLDVMDDLSGEKKQALATMLDTMGEQGKADMLSALCELSADQKAAMLGVMDSLDNEDKEMVATMLHSMDADRRVVAVRVIGKLDTAQKKAFLSAAAVLRGGKDQAALSTLLDGLVGSQRAAFLKAAAGLNRDELLALMEEYALGTAKSCSKYCSCCSPDSLTPYAFIKLVSNCRKCSKFQVAPDSGASRQVSFVTADSARLEITGRVFDSPSSGKKANKDDNRNLPTIETRRQTTIDHSTGTTTTTETDADGQVLRTIVEHRAADGTKTSVIVGKDGNSTIEIEPFNEADGANRGNDHEVTGDGVRSMSMQIKRPKWRVEQKETSRKHPLTSTKDDRGKIQRAQDDHQDGANLMPTHAQEEMKDSGGGGGDDVGFGGHSTQETGEHAHSAALQETSDQAALQEVDNSLEGPTALDRAAVRSIRTLVRNYNTESGGDVIYARLKELKKLGVYTGGRGSSNVVANCALLLSSLAQKKSLPGESMDAAGLRVLDLLKRADYIDVLGLSTRPADNQKLAVVNRRTEKGRRRQRGKRLENPRSNGLGKKRAGAKAERRRGQRVHATSGVSISLPHLPQRNRPGEERRGGPPPRARLQLEPHRLPGARAAANRHHLEHLACLPAVMSPAVGRGAGMSVRTYGIAA
jgi:hypothetical protein